MSVIGSGYIEIHRMYQSRQLISKSTLKLKSKCIAHNVHEIHAEYRYDVSAVASSTWVLIFKRWISKSLLFKFSSNRE